MINVISVENMRESDAYTISNKIPSLELMYNAALGVFNNVNWKGNIGIVCGTGNNAGDGYALSIILKKHGINSTLLLVDEKFSNDGKYYYDEAIKEGILSKKLDELSSYDIIVDALLGTGFKGTPRENIASAITMINNAHKYVVSIDINSGLNGNNGLGEEVVQSDLTISIGQYKYGHFLNKAMDYAKKIINVDIGIDTLKEDALLIEDKDTKEVFIPRKHFSNKGTYGYVGILGGSSKYPGAVKLALLGQTALYAGCGVSKVIVPSSIAPMIYANSLESTVFPMPCKNEDMAFDKEKLDEATKGLKALAVGIGWGVSDENKNILEYLLNTLQIPVIIDADGLNNLSQMDLDALNKTKAKVILTPHLKEFSRLMNKSVQEIEEDLVGCVKEFTNKYNVTLLLKGVTTIVADKKKMYFVSSGTPGMATAGSGDVLTGILVGMLGQSQEDITKVIACGAYINGKAGEMAASEYGEIGMVSSDTARCVSKIIKILLD